MAACKMKTVLWCLVFAVLAPLPPAAAASASVCMWAAWLEECDATGWLVLKTSRAAFEEDLSSLGRQGMHLVAADYGRGNWLAYFEESSARAEWRWVSGSHGHVAGALAEGVKSGWKPTGAFYADDPDDPIYFAWMSRVEGESMSETLHYDFNRFAAMWGGMEPDDQSALTGFYLDGSNPWLGWFPRTDDWHATVNIETYDGLVSSLDGYINDGYHVTSMINGHDEWAIFARLAPGAASRWLTRPDPTDVWNAILETSGMCVSVITHGCTAV